MQLVERDRPLALLQQGLEAASGGEGKVAVVSGEAGGGKTALLRAFAEESDPARVLWGWCDDLITPLPLGPFLEISRQAGPQVEAVFAGGDRSALLTSLLDVLEARPHPVLVVVEDIHWADQATLDLLSLLASSIVRLPVLLALTFRPEQVPSRSPVAGLVGRLPIEHTIRIDLQPLSPDGIAELAGDRLDPRLVAELTGGNPLYVSQVLEGGEELPPSVRDLVLARLSGLPEPTRELLDLIAIVPGRVETALLDRCRPGWEDAAEAAEARRVISVDADHVAFRHELTRRAVEEEILRSRQRRLHAEVLAALAEMQVPVGRRVHHASGAGDVAALLELGPEAAAEASRRGAHAQAAAHLRRVLDHASSVPPERRAELEERYWLEAWTIRDLDEALQAALQALATRRTLGEPEAVARTLRMVARVRWYRNDGDEAERLLDEAIATLDGMQDPPPVELAITLAYRASLASIRWSANAARDWADRAAGLLDRLEGAPLGMVLCDIGTVEYLHGEGSPTRLEEAIRVSERVGLHVNVARSQVNLAAGALLRREYDTANHWMDRADQFAEAHQVFTMRGLADAIRAQLSLERGDWDEADRLARRVVEDPGEVGFARLPALTTLARPQLRRGDPEAAETLDESWARAATTDETQRLAPAAAAAGEHAWLLGRPEESTDRLLAAYRRAVESGVARWIGETAFWLQQASDLEDIPGSAEDPYRLMLEGSFLVAADRWEELGCPYEAALAVSLSDDSKRMLASLETLDGLGATPLARRVRSRLRDLGVERVPRGPRRTTRKNPAGLTAQQMDVLRLLAENLTNAEIADRLYLSTRTVDHHVAAIFLKLEVESRHEAVDRAGRSTCWSEQPAVPYR